MPSKKQKPTRLQELKLLEAIEIAGGLSALGRELGVNRQTVYHWTRRGIPANWARAVEYATGVPAEDLRPDVFIGPGA